MDLEGREEGSRSHTDTVVEWFRDYSALVYNLAVTVGGWRGQQICNVLVLYPLKSVCVSAPDEIDPLR